MITENKNAPCLDGQTGTLTELRNRESGLVIVNAFDLLQRQFPEADDIVAGILPTRARAIVSAPAKLGKTRFTLGLALGVATGTCNGVFPITKARRVLYIQAEVSERNLQERLKKMLAVFPVDEQLLRENLLFCNDPRLEIYTGRGGAGYP